jgi:hypothetical protein
VSSRKRTNIHKRNKKEVTNLNDFHKDVLPRTSLNYYGKENFDQ